MFLFPNNLLLRFINQFTPTNGVDRMAKAEDGERHEAAGPDHQASGMTPTLPARRTRSIATGDAALSFCSSASNAAVDVTSFFQLTNADKGFDIHTVNRFAVHRPTELGLR
jgi:hypothetical protein